MNEPKKVIITIEVEVTTPEQTSITPLELVKAGLDETVIPVPSFAPPCGYSINRPVVKGIVEKE